ncbi:MAG: signal peptidase II [Nanobdellota archaeon]
MVNRRLLFISLITTAIIIIDQVAKFFLFGKELKILPFLRIFPVENTGTAFGLFPGSSLLLGIIALIFVTLIFIYIKRFPDNRITNISLGLIAGGALGNMLDRLLMGFVRDFISLGFIPSFNVADTAITIGAVLLIFSSMKTS